MPLRSTWHWDYAQKHSVFGSGLDRTRLLFQLSTYFHLFRDVAQGVSRVRVDSDRCLPARCVPGSANLQRLPELVARPFLGDSGKPAVLLCGAWWCRCVAIRMNHTSFLDAVPPPQRLCASPGPKPTVPRLAVSMGPLRRCADVRVLVANYVMSLAEVKQSLAELSRAQ